jgi:uncharacterized protein (UPF0212 family)
MAEIKHAELSVSVMGDQCPNKHLPVTMKVEYNGCPVCMAKLLAAGMVADPALRQFVRDAVSRMEKIIGETNN